MEPAIYLLDLWHIGHSLRLITRAAGDYNRFCLVSAATGEATGAMTAERLRAYLKGENPLHEPFEYFGNLRARFREEGLINDEIANISID